jgi:membrane protease YdiL (CAAX protease family)
MNTIDTILDMQSPITERTDRVSRSRFLSLNAWFTLALCGVAVGLPLLFGKPDVWKALDPKELVTWQTMVGGVLGLVFGVAMIFLITHWRPLHVISEHLEKLVAWETLRTLDVFFVALLAAFGEELLFRGALQPLIGLVPAALVFGILHATSLPHIILASLLGLWLGLLYQWSGSLWPPIVAHLALDVATGLLLAHKLGAEGLPEQGA